MNMNFKHIKKDTLELVQSPLLQGFDDISHCFTTRLGGVSEGYCSSLSFRTLCGDTHENIEKNYEILANACGYDEKRMVCCRQIHGDRIYKVTEKDCGKGFFRENNFGDADALMTAEKNIPLVCFTADCIPILLYDSIAKICAAVHSGWRGTALNIAAKTVEAMSAEYGSKPQNVRVAIGPSIGKCCFEVGNEVLETFIAAYGSAYSRFFNPNKKGKFMCDLLGICFDLLLQAGVLPENIDIAYECTFCRSDLYFSHRATDGKRGNMLAMIMLK